ncbi:TPA: universal stress protein [Candidatus Marinimicrobia bacterium]|nr:universal stress protein [Candidatus Neomarinimicrobiota bacterium]HBY19241.1 universal stress protein [Candidatus Neomarinimicrobiota bacterium]
MTMKIKKILLTTDFSDYAHYAVIYAVEFADKFKAEIGLLHVIEPIIAPTDFTWESYDIAELEKRSREYTQESLDKIIREKIPDKIKATPIIRYGRSFEEIIRCAKEEKFDIIIMSTHGLTGISHILFGSTAEKVVRKSPVPVLTVRDPQHKFEML